MHASPLLPDGASFSLSPCAVFHHLNILCWKKFKQWCKGFISKDSQCFLCLHLSAECQLTGLSSASCVSYVHCGTVFGHCAQNKCEQSLLLTYSLTLFTVSWRTRSSVSCTGSILICSMLIFGQLMSGLVYRVGANRTHGVGQASFIYSVCALSPHSDSRAALPHHLSIPAPGRPVWVTPLSPSNQRETFQWTATRGGSQKV